jgi:hypothetical protein
MIIRSRNIIEDERVLINECEDNIVVISETNSTFTGSNEIK